MIKEAVKQNSIVEKYPNIAKNKPKQATDTQVIVNKAFNFFISEFLSVF